MKRLVSYFFQGLVFSVPVGLTIWVVTAVFSAVDGWVRSWFGGGIPGLGILILLALITLCGFLASNFMTRGFLIWVESSLERLPLIKLLYASLKDLMNAFVGQKKRFDKPALVELAPNSGVRAVGFVTRDSMLSWGLEEDIAVYLPQAYNFAGQVLVVPRRSITPLDAESADIMAFIVSGGVSGKS